MKNQFGYMNFGKGKREITMNLSTLVRRTQGKSSFREIMESQFTEMCCLEIVKVTLFNIDQSQNPPRDLVEFVFVKQPFFHLGKPLFSFSEQCQMLPKMACVNH